MPHTSPITLCVLILMHISQRKQMFLFIWEEPRRMKALVFLVSPFIKKISIYVTKWLSIPKNAFTTDLKKIIGELNIR